MADPITEVYTVHNGSEYGVFVLVMREHYNMLAIDSSFGGFVNAWTHIGEGTHFHQFLGRQTDPSYLGKKFVTDDENPIDWEKTTTNIQDVIVQMRKAGECTAEEARDAWPESLFTCEYDYANWDRDQSLLGESAREIVTMLSPRKREFLGMWEHLWPKFVDQLTHR